MYMYVVKRFHCMHVRVVMEHKGGYFIYIYIKEWAAATGEKLHCGNERMDVKDVYLVVFVLHKNVGLSHLP